jgi:hypothetical protein
MDFTRAELEFIDCVRKGTEYKLTLRQPIGARLIRKMMLGVPLCDGEEPVPTPCGIRLFGAEILDRINLDNGRGVAGSIMPGLVLDDCIIHEGIDISYAELGKLSIEHSQINELRAVRAVIHGQVLANDIKPVTPNGYCFISLHSALIHGDVQFRRAILYEPPQPDMHEAPQFAIDLRNATVKGTTYMRDMVVKGTIDLSLATINGHVSLRNSHIDPRDGQTYALNASNCNIDGNLTMRSMNGYSFIALGNIRLARSFIGAVIMQGALIDPKMTDEAGIYLKGSRIKGRLYFRDGFVNTSTTDLTGVTVGLDFNAPGAVFSKGINAAGLEIDGECDLSNVKTDDAIIDLQDATFGRTLKVGGIKAHLDLRRAQAKTYDDEGQCDSRQHKISLDGFVYERLEHPSAKYTDILKTDKERIKWLARQGKSYSFSRGFFSVLWRNFLGAPKLNVKLIDYRPQPFVQLSRVLRDQGLEGEARQILRAKQWIETFHNKGLNPSGGLMQVFGFLFGFGYSSGRAVVALVAYLALGATLAAEAERSGLLVYDARPMTLYAQQIKQESKAIVPVMTNVSGDKFDPDQMMCKDIGAAYYALDLMIPLIDLHIEDQCKINKSLKGFIFKETIEFKALNPYLAKIGLKHKFTSLTAGLKLVDLAKFIHTFYAMLGWVLVSLAILTFSGLLRYKDRSD